jgi:hypothetical protein
VIELYVGESNGVDVTIDVSGGVIENFVPDSSGSGVVEYHLNPANTQIRIAGVRYDPADPPTGTFRLGSLIVDASIGSINVAVAAESKGVAAEDAIDEISPAAIAVAIPLVDSDEDGILDSNDNCVFVPNGPIRDEGGGVQLDTNSDGYGNICDADLNNDDRVNFGDLSLMKSVFFTDDLDGDIDGDGRVNFGDLSLMKTMFFNPPGPSGLDCAGTVPCPAP